MLLWKGVVAGRRILAAVLFSVAAACAGSSVGTGNADCMELCQKGKDKRCPGSEALNCEDNCLSEDARAETSGCRSSYETSLQCSASLEDICTVAKDCANEVKAYLACVAEFCETGEAEFCP
jgi:hypothetical protein